MSLEYIFVPSAEAKRERKLRDCLAAHAIRVRRLHELAEELRNIGQELKGELKEDYDNLMYWHGPVDQIWKIAAEIDEQTRRMPPEIPPQLLR